MENRNPYGGLWGFQPQPQLTKYRISRVNGEAGARSFQMAPESETILLDETAPIVWLVKTDSAGYPQIFPYDISPHIEKPPIDINALSARIDKLEELINANLKSNAGSSKQSKHQNTPDASN